MNLNEKGVTLLELLIAVGIFSTVLGLTGAAYVNNLKSSVNQQELSQLNHNLRATLDFMSNDIKLAGLDPTGEAKAGIESATNSEITFTLDITGGLGVDGKGDGVDNDDDGIVDEGKIIVPAPPTPDPSAPEWYDGKTDSIGEKITYKFDASSNTIYRNTDKVASHIEALNFVYLDKSGVELGTPDVVVKTLTTAQISQITSVQLTIVARANSRPYLKQIDASFKNQMEDVIFNKNDGVLRKMGTITIACRNLNDE